MHFNVTVRVLLCVDEDPVLPALLAAVEDLVKTTKLDEIVVLHVERRKLFSTTPDRKAREITKAFVSKVTEKLSHAHASVATMLAVGDPAECIVRAAEANEADLIVMGARGHHRDFSVGSVSQKVVALTLSDVLVVRAHAPTPDTADEAFKALITVDGSEGSEAGITSFMTKLRAERAAIHLIHVVEPLPALWEVGPRNESVMAPLARRAETLLGQAASLLAARGLESQSEWHYGSPAEHILETARRRECGLIVVGSHGHSPLAQLLLAPLTHRILRHAPCSVLCARAWSPEWSARLSEWTQGLESQLGMA